jgi:predicted ATPase/DNA-binding CsgD family transcriptional regulator
MWSTTEAPSNGPEPHGDAPGRTSRSAFAKPSADNRLIGRETELATLTGLLFDPTVRILTLTGPAGVGKSRLARAAAQPPLFRGDILSVDLSPTDDADDAWRAIANCLGMPAQQGADTMLPKRLADRIGDRELLLVLDNCDLVASSLSLDIAQLSAHCSGLRVLLTSRVSLDIYDERLFPVRPFPVPAAGAPPTAGPESPAVSLFVERARAQRPNYALLEEDVDVITDICATLDGLPLAIELSAGAVGMLGPRALLTQLKRGEWPASSRLLDLPARHRTVAESLSWGDPVLSLEQRRFLQQLTVCEGQFDLATVQHLTDLSWPRMMRQLETLVHMSLLQRVERAGGDIVFRMLNMVRNYYLHHEPPEPERLALARDRHAEHFAGLAAAAEGATHGVEQIHWLPAVRWRFNDYRAAVAHFQSKDDHPAAIRTLLALDVALDDLSRLPEMLDQLLGSIGRLQERCAGAEGPLLARALETAATWSLATGAHDTAGTLLSRASKVYQTLSDPAGTARVVGHLAEVERRAASPGAAASHAALAISELDRLGDRRGAAAARRTLALIESDQDQRSAESHLLRALEDLGSAGELRARAVTLTDLARVRAAADRHVEAYTAVREAMELLRDAGGLQHVAGALETAARVLPQVSPGQQHRAARLLLDAQEIRRNYGLPRSEDSPLLEKSLDRLRLALGESTLTVLRSQARSTTPLAALNDALSAPPAPLRASTPDGGALEVLTPRQAQIARMVADGLTNRQIARALGLSEWTVINHLRQVMQKLKCPSRVHVARCVQQAG